MTEFRKEQLKRDLTEHGLNASGIPYDNSESELEANNVQDAIDEISEGGTGGGTTVKVSDDDTTANYLENKIVGSGGSSVTVLNPGGDEQLQVDSHEYESDNQYLWKTIEADSGSSTASSETDTFTISGGDGTETSITDKTLSIDISDDGIKDYHIDFGTGEDQVSAGNVPIVDSGGYYTSDNVEGALQEIAGGGTGGGAEIGYSDDDVSSPPTDAELDSAFGTPATVGAGYVGVINDNGAGTDEYICWSDGTNWFCVAGTKAGNYQLTTEAGDILITEDGLKLKQEV